MWFFVKNHSKNRQKTKSKHVPKIYSQKDTSTSTLKKNSSQDPLTTELFNVLPDTYDANILSTAKTNWYFGEWEELHRYCKKTWLPR